jgi:type II secretory pathway pseudopilin PulG
LAEDYLGGRVIDTMKRIKDKLSFLRGQSGVSLLETLVAVAVLGMIVPAFLSGLATASEAAFTADEQTTAESLARSQMEWVKNTVYVEDAPEYPPAPIPSVSDYVNYTVEIIAEPLHTPDEGIQKITVTVRHSGKLIVQLESYKGQR